MNQVQHSETAIDDFLRRTVRDTESQIAEMGTLKDKGVTPEAFGRICQSFADGVKYIQNRFGTVPKAILISDENGPPRYNIETKTIYLPRRFIDWLTYRGFILESKTKPYLLNYCEQAAMYGVEEAYHHYQFSSNWDKYVELAKRPRPHFSEPDYDEQPIEKEAAVVVQQAIEDFGYKPIVAEGYTFASQQDVEMFRRWIRNNPQLEGKNFGRHS